MSETTRLCALLEDCLRDEMHDAEDTRDVAAALCRQIRSEEFAAEEAARTSRARDRVQAWLMIVAAICVAVWGVLMAKKRGWL